MQIFSFCMADFITQFYPVFKMDYGAPEEIRTPDPQIRSLIPEPRGRQVEMDRVVGLSSDEPGYRIPKYSEYHAIDRAGAGSVQKLFEGLAVS
jgi:hypothetical protein